MTGNATSDVRPPVRRPRTALVMAGGTGGHIFPALAVADYLRDQGWRIVWLGAKGRMEATLVPPRGYEMEWVSFSGVRGGGALKVAFLPARLLIACYQSARAIFRQRPEVVVGFGGFTAFPGGLMATLLNKPLVVHEQNSIAGLTNRVLAGLADRVLVGFPGAFKERRGGLQAVLPKPSQVFWCGNPVRADIAAVPAPEARFAGRSGPLRMLVVGGSQGAAALNQTLPQALARIPADKRPVVTHQAGKANTEKVQALYAEAGVEAKVVPFLDDMAAEYAQADVVVCRSGALTIAELAAAGVASILVPFPHAVDDHQTGNARFLADNGAARLMPQPEMTPERLAGEIASLDRQTLLVMAAAARSLAKTDATRQVAEACMELAG